MNFSGEILGITMLLAGWAISIDMNLIRYGFIACSAMSVVHWSESIRDLRDMSKGLTFANERACCVCVDGCCDDMGRWCEWMDVFS